MRRLTLLVFASCILTACGPKVHLSRELNSSPLRTIAILPTKTSSDISRERVQLVTRALGIELQGRGYEILNSSIIERECGGEECPGRPALFTKYNLDAMATLHLRTAAKTNFLAGYVNVLTGTLSFMERDGTEFITIDHTESERGGLLFNSGQIIEGIQSQITETTGDSFRKLAEKFAATVVKELPRPEQLGEVRKTAATLPSVKKVSIVPFRRNAYQICAHGTPQLTASLISRFGRSTLREAEPGNYCGVFSLRTNSAARAAKSVEIRGAFGEASQQDLSSSFPHTCDLTDLEVLVSNNTQTLSLTCPKTDPGMSTSKCSEQFTICSQSRLVIYGASSELGPYRKIGEFKGSSWNQSKEASLLPNLIEIIALDKSGYSSAPRRVLIRPAQNIDQPESTEL